MSKANLESKIPLLEAIPVEKIKAPSNMPVAVYIREAEAMLAAGRRDLSELETVGFEAGWLDDLKVRVGALRQAESRLRMGLSRVEGVLKSWDELSKAGFKRLKVLKATLLFAYRNDELLTKTVREAVGGRSAHAMIQVLYNLATIGRANPGPLEAMRFDLSRLDEAAELAERLGRMLGAADAERAAAYKPGRLRNAAFTHLKDGLKELREYALYVFRDDELKIADYTSDYLRKKRVMRKMRAVATGDRAENGVSARAKGSKSAELAGEKQVVPGVKAFSQEKEAKKTGARPGENGLGSPDDGRNAAVAGKRPAELCKSGEVRRMNEPGVRRDPLRRPLEEVGSAYEPLARVVRELPEAVRTVFEVVLEDGEEGKGRS